MDKTSNTKPHISVAPMMDWTDRHCRYFLRLIAPNIRLYTEMVTTGALIHGDSDRFLRFNEAEHPIALQLGGCDPKDLTTSARMGEDFGYDEINLNCGCPSDRVQKGKIGAILMKEPEMVAECVKAMADNVSIPVTVKCRIGVDDFDDYDFLRKFVDKSVENGVETIIIHARKCWLKGLSPKENREIPILDYDRVFTLKKNYPHLEVILNGGITTIEDIQRTLTHTDGAMIGREAYQNPYFLSQIENEIYGTGALLSREAVALKMIDYAKEQDAEYGTPVKSITRHMMGLFQGLPGAKNWRRALSTFPYEDGAGAEVFEKALDAMAHSGLSRISA